MLYMWQLQEKKLKIVEEMHKSLIKFFAFKDQHGIKKLEEQWQKVIKNNREYFA